MKILIRLRVVDFSDMCDSSVPVIQSLCKYQSTKFLFPRDKLVSGHVVRD